MESSYKNIEYIEVTLDNILLATKIEMEIFPSSCGYLSYLTAYKKGKPYFLAYYNGEPMGITGLYEDEKLKENGVCWLGWYGVLRPFRRKGLGKAILLDTIAEAKKRGYAVLRLYTSAVMCPEACILYDRIMDVGEDYTLEEQENKRRVYSKSLNGSAVERWNNRYLYLSANHDEEDYARKLYLKHLRQNKL